jgi:hypothetical protein
VKEDFAWHILRYFSFIFSGRDGGLPRAEKVFYKGNETCSFPVGGRPDVEGFERESGGENVGT